jgi:hypothetical protein
VSTGDCPRPRTDALHLAVGFDLDAETGIRYTAAARHLLQTSIECDTSG